MKQLKRLAVIFVPALAIAVLFEYQRGFEPRCAIQLPAHDSTGVGFPSKDEIAVASWRMSGPVAPIEIYSLKSGKHVESRHDPNLAGFVVGGFSLKEGGRMVVFDPIDSSIRIIDRSSGKGLLQLKAAALGAHSGSVRDRLAFSDRSALFVFPSAVDQGGLVTMLLFDLETLHPIATLPPSKARAVFTPSGKELVTFGCLSDEDTDLQPLSFWDANNGELRRSSELRPDAIEFLNEGELISVHVKEFWGSSKSFQRRAAVLDSRSLKEILMMKQSRNNHFAGEGAPFVANRNGDAFYWTRSGKDIESFVGTRLTAEKAVALFEMPWATERWTGTFSVESTCSVVLPKTGMLLELRSRSVRKPAWLTRLEKWIGREMPGFANQSGEGIFFDAETESITKIDFQDGVNGLIVTPDQRTLLFPARGGTLLVYDNPPRRFPLRIAGRAAIGAGIATVVILVLLKFWSWRPWRNSRALQ